MHTLRRRSSLIFKHKPQLNEFQNKRKEEEKLNDIFITSNIRQKVYNEVFSTMQDNHSFDESSYTNNSSTKSYKYSSINRKRKHFYHWIISLF